MQQVIWSLCRNPVAFRLLWRGSVAEVGAAAGGKRSRCADEALAHGHVHTLAKGAAWSQKAKDKTRLSSSTLEMTAFCILRDEIKQLMFWWSELTFKLIVPVFLSTHWWRLLGWQRHMHSGFLSTSECRWAGRVNCWTSNSSCTPRTLLGNTNKYGNELAINIVSIMSHFYKLSVVREIREFSDD